MVSAVMRFNLAKMFSEGRCSGWPTSYLVLSEYRESTDRLDRLENLSGAAEQIKS